MDMLVSQIDAATGKPTKTWAFEGSTTNGKPSMSVMHRFADDAHLALGFRVKAESTLKLAAPDANGDTATIDNAASTFGLGTVVKFNPTTETIPWYKTFVATGGSSIFGVDGDATGNMYVAGSTCVPCTDVNTCEPETNHGYPTGNLLPTCTEWLTKLNAADGAEAWKTEVPAAVGLYTIRYASDGIYAWANLNGAATLGSTNVESASSGASTSAIMIKFGLDGAYLWHSLPGGTDSISAGYVDVSTDYATLVVTGSFSGTKVIGGTRLTAKYGTYTSFVAKLSTTDGSVAWVEQIPMQRGVQVTSDNEHVAVFAQTTGSSNVIELTDATGKSQTLRSRGSWDLIAIKLDATDGSGVWAIDGGGDGMEYFHGFGMTGNDQILISGYSRSNSFHFGDHSLTNAQSAANGGDGLNKMFTVGISATSQTPPPCISSCSNGIPVVGSGKCFIDQHCYSDDDFSTYAEHGCYKCDADASQFEWTGPATSGHCFFDGKCIADQAPKMVPSGYSSSPSACEACDISKTTSAYSIKEGYTFVDGSCVKPGCVDNTAANFDAFATTDDGSCIFAAIGTQLVDNTCQISCADSSRRLVAADDNETFLDHGCSAPVLAHEETLKQEMLAFLQRQVSDPAIVEKFKQHFGQPAPS